MGLSVIIEDVVVLNNFLYVKLSPDPLAISRNKRVSELSDFINGLKDWSIDQFPVGVFAVAPAILLQLLMNEGIDWTMIDMVCLTGNIVLNCEVWHRVASLFFQ